MPAAHKPHLQFGDACGAVLLVVMVLLTVAVVCVDYDFMNESGVVPNMRSNGAPVTPGLQ